jgi:signal recognition particle subunit SRP54
MFDTITERFQNLFSTLKGKKCLTEENITDAVTQVRLALLEADVSYPIASNFVKKVRSRALGEATIKSISPGEQFTKIIHDELIQLMGGEEVKIEFRGSPSVCMVCGLQGVGKTTHCAKLAYYLSKRHKKVLLAACDLQRPAAIEQLQILGQSIDVPVFTKENAKNPRAVALAALEKARQEQIDVLIVDTAGRLHIDEQLMEELKELKEVLSPDQLFFIASAALSGQKAVETALAFDRAIQFTGIILTMLDGSARAGAALAMRESTGKPLLFEGIGEKLADFQLFNPHSMADRILGMGDIINLVRKAEEHVSVESKEEMEKKLRKGDVTYEDYRKQLGMMRKMGPLKGLFKMLPGVPAGIMENSQENFQKMEAIISSMTSAEREGKVDMEMSRRRRIARGSGTSIDDVHRLVKGFKNIKHLLKDKSFLKQHLQNFKDKDKEKAVWR